METPWCCPKCTAETLPFNCTSDNEIFIENLRLTKNVREDLNIIPQNQFKEFLDECNNIFKKILENVDKKDLQDFPNPVNFKYHGIHQFNQIKPDPISSLGLIQTNLASIGKHFDDLNLVLSLLKFDFHIIGISEHKIQKKNDDNSFSNINLEGYHPFVNPYNKPVKQQVTIKINNTAINEKEYIKYLGVLVDSSLNWKHHISTLAKKILRAIGIMYKLRPFLPLNVMKNVYYSLTYSEIIYAIEVWGSAVNSEILILQKMVMRLMTFNDIFPSTPGPLRPTDPIFVTLNCMKVEDIHKYQVAKFVFKCLHVTTPVQFHNWYKLNNQIHEHYTRSNYNVNDGIIINNLSVPTARTTNYGLKQLKVSGTRIWNELPFYLKNAPSLNLFLKNLKVYYISSYK